MAKVKLRNNLLFERFETKYKVNEEQFKCFFEEIQNHMVVDHYGLTTISNIYYDTDDFEIIRTSLDKPNYKEKLRLRSYGIPKMDSTVFLELKKKYNKVTYKRRIALPLLDAYDYFGRNQIPKQFKNNKSFQEIDWFKKSHNLSPAVYLAYDRVALFGKEDSEFRITIDKNIRWRTEDVELEKGDFGDTLLKESEYLIEIKTQGALPLWAAKILSDLKIYSSSFSKYGRIYQENLLYNGTDNNNKNENENEKNFLEVKRYAG